MTTSNRDDRGRFSEKFRDQDVLNVFDFEASAEDPFLTVSEVTDALERHFDVEVSDEAVRIRLEELLDAGAVDRREFGPSVAYRALVGPALAAEVAARSDERQETSRDEFVKL